MEGPKVTPFDVNGGDVTESLDYHAVIKQFGCDEMTPELLQQLKKAIDSDVHPVMRRAVCSHRGFDELLKHHASGKPWYLYTGRGPSSDGLHLGHLVPMTLTAWLQRVFKVPVVIQITDDEKFLFKDGLSLDRIAAMAHQNIADILACGFDPERTFVFRNTEYLQHLYPTVLEIQKRVTTHISQVTFGFDEQTNIGQLSFPAIQAAPAFAQAFRPIFGEDFNPKEVRCLIPCAIDQDPYFRLTREVARKLKLPRPWLLHTTFLPGLQGVNTKMSASIPESAVFMSDTEKQIRKKINRGFSGGQELLEDHQRLGGNPDIDVAYNILRYLESDDSVLESAAEGFRRGTVSCGEMKKLAGDAVVMMVSSFKQLRENIDDCDVRAVQTVRPIDLRVVEGRGDKRDWAKRWMKSVCHACDPVWRCEVCGVCLRCADDVYHKYDRVCGECNKEGWCCCAKHGTLMNMKTYEGMCRWCM